MSTDARLSVGLPGHPKTKKLIRRLDASAGWSLVCLILWARANRPDGDLSGMSAEDIELAADWTGENDAFVRELASVGFLDGVEGAYQLHDWADHQPWSAGSDLRSLKAKWNAVKRHHGEAEADRQVPEYARIRAASSDSDASSKKIDATSNAGSSDAAMRPAASSNAPSPSPSPYPKEEKPPHTPRLTPRGQSPDDGSGRRSPSPRSSTCARRRASRPSCGPIRSSRSPRTPGSRGTSCTWLGASSPPGTATAAGCRRTGGPISATPFAATGSSSGGSRRPDPAS